MVTYCKGRRIDSNAISNSFNTKQVEQFSLLNDLNCIENQQMIVQLNFAINRHYLQ